MKISEKNTRNTKERRKSMRISKKNSTEQKKSGKHSITDSVETNITEEEQFDLDNVSEDLNTSEVDDVKETICNGETDYGNEENVENPNNESDVKEDKAKVLERLTKFKNLKHSNRKKKPMKVSKKRACDVIELLQAPKKKRDIYNRACKLPKELSRGKEYGWDSFVHITRHMRHCMLNQEWHNFPDLILLLLRHPGQAMKSFKVFIKEISYINFLVNSDPGNSDLLDQFYHQMFVPIPKRKMMHLEVWYRDE